MATSTRPPPDLSIGLGDYENQAVYSSKGDFKARGRLVQTPLGQRILVSDATNSDAVGQVKTLLEFVLLGGHMKKGSVAEAKKNIFLGDGQGKKQSLADEDAFMDRGKDKLKSDLDRLNVTQVGQLASFHAQNLSKAKVCFRVCRFNEDPSEGLHITGTCLRRDANARSFDYFVQLNNHVWCGSRSSAHAPFISATLDLEQALWWSYGGINKIVAIDLEKLGDDCLYWDVGGCHKDLLFASTAQNFARISSEVVFDNNIPQNACSVLDVKWNHVNRISLNDRCLEMPSSLPNRPDGLVVLDCLQGSTRPLKIKLLTPGENQESQLTSQSMDQPSTFGGAASSASAAAATTNASQGSQDPKPPGASEKAWNALYKKSKPLETAASSKSTFLDDDALKSLLKTHINARSCPRSFTRPQLLQLAKDQRLVSEAYADIPNPTDVSVPKARKRKNPGADGEYVLKRGGFRFLDPWHSSSEFFALKLYQAADLKVPNAALYSIRVVEGRHSVDFPMTILLTSFISGVPFKTKLTELTSGASQEQQNQAQRLRQAVCEGMALDIALANIDVCGPDYSNLIVANDGDVYRVDVGGSAFFDPAGSRKDVWRYFDSTRDSVNATAAAFVNLRAPDSSSVSKNVSESSVRAARSQLPNSLVSTRDSQAGPSIDRVRNSKPVSAIEANKAIFLSGSRQELHPGELADSAKKILGVQFQKSVDIFLSKTKTGDSSWVALLHTVCKRLQILSMKNDVVAPLRALPRVHSVLSRPEESRGAAEAMPSQSPKRARLPTFPSLPSPPSNMPPPPARPPQSSSAMPPPPARPAPFCKEIIIESRSIKDKKRAALVANGFKLIDVTSKATDKWKRLSPFFPHGGIPVPGSPNEFSQSLEGIWQGLKVFDKESVDLSKFDIRNGEGLKRTVRKRGKVEYHWWGPLPRDDNNVKEPEKKLAYVAARADIYVPAYTWVMENKAKDLVRELAQEASMSKIALLDYFKTEDLEDITRPLAHAGVLKKYVQNNFRTLVSERT